MSVKIGLNAKLYRNTGNYDSPTWNEVKKVKDLTLTGEVNLSDVSSRASGGSREYAATLNDFGIDFGLVSDDVTEHVEDRDAIREAFFAKTAIELLALDGDIETAGSEGLRVTCICSQFTRNENLEEGIMYEVGFKPTPSDHTAAWYVVE